MNKALQVLAIVALLLLVIGACASSSSSGSVEPAGSIHINAATYEKDVASGDIVEFFSTVTHDVQSGSTMIVRASPEAGNRWKFALCYEIECFISLGDKPIEKQIELSPNSPMEFDLKIFAPDRADSGASSTVTFEMQSASSPVTETVSFTATVR